MGKGKSSGQERAEKLSETIKQMEEAIQNFQPEYDEKKKQLDDLTLQIEVANEDFSNLFEQARKEVRQEMSDELEAAKKEKESIEALVSEGFDLKFIPFRPTAESFAKYFYEKMSSKGYMVHQITVYETPNNCATYKKDENGWDKR